MKIIDKTIELGFTSRALAQISLPHSKLNTHYFERTSGLMTLSVVSVPKIGLPYGTYPRLLLAWLCSEAVRTQSPILHLGSNQTEFLKKLKLHTGGSYIAPLKDQTNRLLSSVFRLDFADKNLKGFKHLLLADSGFEFWEPQTGEWEAYIKLTTDFFNDIINNPVPIDLNVLHELRKSPMAMDVYTWLVYRTFGILSTGNRPVKIAWTDLQAQFGANYGSPVNNELFELNTEVILQRERQGLIDFRRKFIVALQKIKCHYPELEQIIAADSKFLTINNGTKMIK
ncbi:protein kinase [Pelistega sp. NLN82]|uniref:Protein kinase n=1 Tax=Pelistega ratti TaxID=2652177 RepID=A0A6L9Y811_9BURK|nr:replication protein RepA [Pelistega ratti]NEN76519.1 protein kinase [Pelistega ratti]